MKHRLPAAIPYDLTIGAAAETLPYQSDATVYDSAGATGSINGGTVQPGDAIYDSASATGSITGGTVLPPETQL